MALGWAQKRRFHIIGGAALIVVTLLAGVIIAVVYEAPSCSDRKQNQDESGVDCGGSCAYLCRAEIESPRIVFARAITAPNGRTDVIAYVENRNQDAESKNAPYTAEIFDAQGRLLGTRQGTIDLPARSVVPVYVPNIGMQGARAFVTISEESMWRLPRDTREPLFPGTPEILAGEQPRIRAVIENRDVVPSYDRTVIATVFDSAGNAIAASRTVLRQVPAQGTAEAVFTWNDPFIDAVRAEVRVVPVLP
ncbi:MAG TPA: hypothetical protein PK609_03095 [Candidatus Paceibacterota bacterium]|nr:hypothetical protein [Candidatus Paceibacterota bacterium]